MSYCLRRALALSLAGAIVILPMQPSLAQRAVPLPNAASAASEGFSAERLARLDTAMQKALADQKFGGMVTLLARNGRIVDLKIYGDASPGRKMSRDTIFRIYSMTKVVTGVAMMMLFEEGKWRLDDPVSKFLPELKGLKVATALDSAGNPVLVDARRGPTMRELMSHQAGFTYGFTQEPADNVYRKVQPMNAKGMADYVGKLAQVPLLYQPGDSWSYSQAVDVQGAIVEKLSGMRFGDFLAERIFKPLKMADTGFFVPQGKLGRVAEVYTNDQQTGALRPGGGFGGAAASPPVPTAAPAFESGGAGLFSTVDDYARFAQMLANKGVLDGARLLAPATVEVMQANVVPTSTLISPTMLSGFSANVGFGMDVQTVIAPRAAGRLEGEGTISWEGAAGTWFWADPKNAVIFVGMIQNFGRAGPNGFDPVTRPLVYQALVSPKD